MAIGSSPGHQAFQTRGEAVAPRIRDRDANRARRRERGSAASVSFDADDPSVSSLHWTRCIRKMSPDRPNPARCNRCGRISRSKGACRVCILITRNRRRTSRSSRHVFTRSWPSVLPQARLRTAKSPALFEVPGTSLGHGHRLLPRPPGVSDAWRGSHAPDPGSNWEPCSPSRTDGRRQTFPSTPISDAAPLTRRSQPATRRHLLTAYATAKAHDIRPGQRRRRPIT